jgi:hypothetical protein
VPADAVVVEASEAVVSADALVAVVWVVCVVWVVPEVVAVLATVDVHETAVGRSVTPEILQKDNAKSVAFFWSSSLQSSARQHATSPRNDLLEQIHLMSRLAQFPILDPLVSEVTQLRCATERSVCCETIFEPYELKVYLQHTQGDYPDSARTRHLPMR